MVFKSLLVVVLLCAVSGCAHAPREGGGHAAEPYASGEYAAASEPSWNYPESDRWPAQCRDTSSQQSPIDLINFAPTPWNDSYVVTQATLDPFERNVVFTPNPGPSVTFNPGVGGKSGGVTYTPIGFHFHNAREHLASGDARLEMHIKAVDADKNVAVFAAQWELGGGVDTTLAEATASLGVQTSAPRAVDVGRILRRFTQLPFFHYMGSLTTPPCTPGIRWFVLRDPIRTNDTSISELMTALQAAGVSRTNVRTLREYTTPPPTVYLVTPKSPRP